MLGLVEATQPTIYLYLLLFRIRCKKTAETQRTRREKEERRKRDINKLLFSKGLQQFCFLCYCIYSVGLETGNKSQNLGINC